MQAARYSFSSIETLTTDKTILQEGSDLIDMDEFYQMKEELQPNLKLLINKVSYITLPGY